MNRMKRVQILDVGTRIFRRSTRSNFQIRDFNWFAFDPSYLANSTYGSYKHVFKVLLPLRLYNLSSLITRSTLAGEASDERTREQLVEALNADEQYSGGLPNLRAHELMFDILQPLGFDGTYMNEKDVSAADLDDLAGPSEVVLFRTAAATRIRRLPNETFVDFTSRIGRDG